MLGLGNLQYTDGGLIHLIWAALAIIVVLWFLESHGRDTLNRFVSAIMQHRLATSLSVEQRVARLGFILLALISAVFALRGPYTVGDEGTVSAGRISADIVVVLDVSRSMLADDAAPTRLERAKADIADMVDKMKGHRVGLVAFAGRASVLAPLTPDRNFFRMILNSVDTKSVSLGGTKIGLALNKAIDVFDPGPGAKLILLITDGEDQDSYPKDEAKRALEAGIRIVSIGIGSEDGSKITLVDPETKARSLLMHEGAPVISRLDGDLLRDIALTTEGAYVPAGVAVMDMQSIVSDHLEPLTRDTSGTITRKTEIHEHYAWFVLGSLIFLFIAVLVGASAGRSKML